MKSKIINSNPNMLEGLDRIAEFIGKTKLTASNWILHHGLPATKSPQGNWLTHKGLIMEWMFQGHKAELEARVKYMFEDDRLERIAGKIGVTMEQYKRIINSYDRGAEFRIGKGSKR